MARVPAFFCFKHNLWLRLMALRSATSRDALAKLVKLLPQHMIDFLLSKPSFYLGGMLCGLSLFVEEARRRPELAMYVLPKGLESLWVMARGKGLVFKTGRWGEVLVRTSWSILAWCTPTAVQPLMPPIVHGRCYEHGHGESHHTLSFPPQVTNCHTAQSTYQVSASVMPIPLFLADAVPYSPPQNDPEHLSGFVRRILYQFIGPN